MYVRRYDLAYQHTLVVHSAFWNGVSILVRSWCVEILGGLVGDVLLDELSMGSPLEFPLLGGV